MTRTTGRTLALLGLLQARASWSGAELRERLEVSERTLRRDIDDLRELGYGIEAVRGRYGGYQLGPGAALPPLSLSADEAVAIAVGLRAATLGAVTGLEDASARALAKLEQSLSPSARQRISEVAEAVLPLEVRRAEIDLDVVMVIARAIDSSRCLRIGYTTRGGTALERVVEPHRIVQTTDRWYVLAWDVGKAAWRTLRVDRVSTPTILAETFARRDIPDEHLRAHTSQSISSAPYRHQVVLRMRAPAATVTQRFPPTVAQVSDNGDGTSTLTTGSNSLDELALYLGTSELEFDIIVGDDFREALAGIVARLHRAAHSDAGGVNR